MAFDCSIAALGVAHQRAMAQVAIICAWLARLFRLGDLLDVGPWRFSGRPSPYGAALSSVWFTYLLLALFRWAFCVQERCRCQNGSVPFFFFF